MIERELLLSARIAFEVNLVLTGTKLSLIP